MRTAAFVPTSARPYPTTDLNAIERHGRPAPFDHNGRLARARGLVMQHGWNSTVHQSLDMRLRHWFSAAGDAVVAYAEFAGVRLVAGAPVTAPERLATVAAEFEANAKADGWQVCYFAAEERLRQVGGYAAHVIGAQPSWTPASWAKRFDGSASLRAQRNRARNKGVSAAEVAGQAELGDDVVACYAAWQNSRRLPPLGFLAHTGPLTLGTDALGDKRLFVAKLGGDDSSGHEAEPRVVGYLTASPIPERHGWLIDKVVRHPRAPNGTTELLLDVAVRELGQSAAHITLGLAPLAGPAATLGRDSAPAWLRASEWVARRWCASYYDFAGLYEFKRKFQPDAWEPVYMLTPRRQVGVRDCLAVAAAFLPSTTHRSRALPY